MTRWRFFFKSTSCIYFINSSWPEFGTRVASSSPFFKSLMVNSREFQTLWIYTCHKRCRHFRPDNFRLIQVPLPNAIEFRKFQSLHHPRLLLSPLPFQKFSLDAESFFAKNFSGSRGRKSRHLPFSHPSRAILSRSRSFSFIIIHVMSK